MNQVALILLLLFFASLPYQQSSAQTGSAGSQHATCVLLAAEAEPSPLAVALGSIARRIPGSARASAVRALARLLRAYTETPQPLIVNTQIAASGPRPGGYSA